jgi:hypothetical protein
MKRHSSLKNLDYKSLLKNQNVLYVVLFLAVANVFSYLMLKQLDAIIFFIIIGFLTTYFSKNMIVILLTSMISTFVLVQVNLLGQSVREGMASDRTKSENVDLSGNAATAADVEGGDSTTKPSPDIASALNSLSTSEISVSPKERAAITAGNPTANNTQANKTEPFQQQLSPARFNASDDDDNVRHKPKIDYAATLESAYDNLDKLLSSDAIRNMSEDTGRLADKQKQLMGNIDKMTPIMEKAGNILSKIDIGGIMGGLNDKLKSFDKLKPKGIMDETTA